jgi:DNA-binding transcriptional LysR family regulator
MTLNQFALFVAVAKSSSITKASAELRVSQPSVSQQLRQLELHYGAKLYRRLSRGIEITEAGQKFLRKIIPILMHVARLRNGHNFGLAKKVAAETLTVGGTFSASAVLLPGLLARLRKQHPKAELELRTSTSEQLERLVLTSALDLAVIPQPAHSKDLMSEPLRRERLVCFAPAQHRLSKKHRVEISDLILEPFIIRGGNGIAATTETALKQIRDQGWNIKIGMRCDDPMAIKSAVRHGMGVGVGFEETVKSEITSGEFKILRVCGLDLEGETFIIYPKKRPLFHLAQEFLGLLRGTRNGNQELGSTVGKVPQSNRRSRYPLDSNLPAFQR